MNRPTPVIDYARLASLVSALVVAGGGVLVLLGFVTSDQVAQWAQTIGLVVIAAGGVLAYVLPLAQARKATELVTPVSDPRAGDGTRLVRADSPNGAMPPVDAADGAPVLEQTSSTPDAQPEG